MKQQMLVGELARTVSPDWGLTGAEMAVLEHDWEPRPPDHPTYPSHLDQDDPPPTFLEEWNVLNSHGEVLGCLYDDGCGYAYAPGYEAGYLDYGS